MVVGYALAKSNVWRLDDGHLDHEQLVIHADKLR